MSNADKVDHRTPCTIGVLCTNLPCEGYAQNIWSVPDSLVQAGDELDERLVQMTADRAGDPGTEALPRAPQHVSLPGIQGRLQGPGEPAHAMDVSEELLVCHVGVKRHYSCRLPTPIKLNDPQLLAGSRHRWYCGAEREKENQMDLKGKTAVVTGGAAGIGLDTCRRLVKEGCSVTLWDVDAAGLARARKELSRSGAKVFAYTCDVTKGARVAELARRAVKDMGQVDILVNNAGILVPGTFLEQPVEKWQKMVDVNLVALLHTTHAFLPGMNARNCGAIVNVSSGAATVGVAGLAVYCATKWAVWGLTESLRHESWNAGARGVHWASIHPLYVAAGMFAGA